MANLTQTLINKVNQLTAIVNEMLSNAKKIVDLPTASTPLDASDYFIISQDNVSKKIDATQVGAGGGSSGKIQYGEALIFGASGNTQETLQVGDYVQRVWGTNEFWYLAKYNGPDPDLKTSYTIYNSTEFT